MLYIAEIKQGIKNKYRPMLCCYKHFKSIKKIRQIPYCVLGK